MKWRFMYVPVITPKDAKDRGNGQQLLGTHREQYMKCILL